MRRNESKVTNGHKSGNLPGGSLKDNSYLLSVIPISPTGTYDILISQRLILQPRLEGNAALQGREKFGVGSGLNDTEVGLRLRYEIYRKFAPYIGVRWGQSFGNTEDLLRRKGENTLESSLVCGVRMWF